MSDLPQAAAKPGPALSPLHELRARFPDAASIENAVGALTRAGIDRARLSLPAPDAATPDAADAPIMADDARQIRTLGSSTAAAAGAMLGAGVTVLTGGAALAAVAVAAAAGAAAGGGVLAATDAQGGARDAAHEDRARQGALVLTVALQDGDDPAPIAALLRQAGGTLA